MANRNLSMGSRLTGWAALGIGLAGVMHLAIAPRHWAHAPAHGLFFAVVGIAEVAWSVAAWRRPSPAVYQIGMVGAGWLIVLWAMTRFLPAPFGHGPEPVELCGVACKLAEGLGMMALGALVWGTLTPRIGRRAAGRVLTGLVIGALIAGLVTYGVARAAEPIFPSLKASAAEHHHEAIPEPIHEHDHELTPTPASEHHP